MISATRSDEVWFFNTRVTIRVPHAAGIDTLSVLEHHGPAGDSPPLHIHVNEDEVFHVLTGEFRFRVGEDETVLTPGQWLLAPKGIAHSYFIASGAGGRWLTITSHTDFERFVRAIGRPALGPGLPELAGPPTPQQAKEVAEIAARFGIRLIGAPLHEKHTAV